MPLLYHRRYTKQLLRTYPDYTFVFGDNMCRAGRGGQAAVCRGEPNTLGIPTKRAPSMAEGAFFADTQLDAMLEVHEALEMVRRLLAEGRTVVVPYHGVGTGRAQLPKRAPKLLAMINRVLFPEETNDPWR